MFTINTYLLNPESGHAGRENGPDENDFFPITDRNIRGVIAEIDPLYIQGCIEILYRDEVILGKDYWELVDQAWGYLVNMVEDFHNDGRGEIHFPETGAKITLTPQSAPNRVMLTVQKNQFILPEREFLEFLMSEAGKFFGILDELILSQDYSAEKERAERMRDILLAD